MEQQTAVEWLFEAIGYKQESDRTTIINIHPDCDITDLIRRAKQMEKEQIINAWRNGDNDSMYEPKQLEKQAEQYYNLTYGTEG